MPRPAPLALRTCRGRDRCSAANSSPCRWCRRCTPPSCRPGRWRRCRPRTAVAQQAAASVDVGLAISTPALVYVGEAATAVEYTARSRSTMGSTSGQARHRRRRVDAEGVRRQGHRMRHVDDVAHFVPDADVETSSDALQIVERQLVQPSVASRAPGCSAGCQAAARCSRATARWCRRRLAAPWPPPRGTESATCRCRSRPPPWARCPGRAALPSNAICPLAWL